jgi:hypothetical protein
MLMMNHRRSYTSSSNLGDSTSEEIDLGCPVASLPLLSDSEAAVEGWVAHHRNHHFLQGIGPLKMTSYFCALFKLLI